MFFPFISMFWMKIKEKARNLLIFHGNLFSFSQNCINYPVSCISWRINILSKKDHLYFSTEKWNICNFTKKVSFHRKSKIFDDFLLFSLFSSNDKQKTHNIAKLYFFFWKKNKYMQFHKKSFFQRKS